MEAAKFGLLGDAEYFAWLEQNANGIFGKAPDVLGEAVRVAVAGKAGIVQRDETEQGERMLLNLGHTLAMVLRRGPAFPIALLHGEAVAIGICQAFRFSAEQGLVSTTDAARVEAHLKRAGLPTRVAHMRGETRPDVAALIKIMGQDRRTPAAALR